MGKNQHVVHDKNGGWNVKGAGNSKVTKHFDTKQSAMDYARKISQNQGSELIIHNKNGKIAQKDSHGKDLHPPKG
jgi:hypothetical protein